MLNYFGNLSNTWLKLNFIEKETDKK